MGISNECAMSGCDNEPLISYAGQWLCGECMSAWHNMENQSIAKRMEEVFSGSSNLSEV